MQPLIGRQDMTANRCKSYAAEAGTRATTPISPKNQPDAESAVEPTRTGTAMAQISGLIHRIRVASSF
jgi:hypothetical protein